MKRNILKSVIALALSGMLFSCGTGAGPGDGVAMKARVNALGDRLEVEVIESPYTFGVHWVITDSAKVYDASGNEISISDIAVGDTLEILYSGQVMLSYPPQIVAAKITVLEKAAG